MSVMVIVGDVGGVKSVSYLIGVCRGYWLVLDGKLHNKSWEGAVGIL